LKLKSHWFGYGFGFHARLVQSVHTDSVTAIQAVGVGRFVAANSDFV